MNFNSYHGTVWSLNCTIYSLFPACPAATQAWLQPKTASTCPNLLEKKWRWGDNSPDSPRKQGLKWASQLLPWPFDTPFPMALGLVPPFPFPLHFLSCFSPHLPTVSSPLLRLAKALPLCLGISLWAQFFCGAFKTHIDIYTQFVSPSAAPDRHKMLKPSQGTNPPIILKGISRTLLWTGCHNLLYD